MFHVFREPPVHIIKLKPHCNHHTRSIVRIYFKTPDEKSFQDFYSNNHPTGKGMINPERTANEPNEKLIQQHIGEQKWNL
jgi:hypothetical protein